jgi:TRIAD3 protein (E3 ubiquitin-protein ligase RNF216)
MIRWHVSNTNKFKASPTANLSQRVASQHMSLPQSNDALDCCCCFTQIEHSCQGFQAVQCHSGHLCCFDCIRLAVQVAVGDHKPVVCMHQSVCTSTFPDPSLECAISDEKLKESYFISVANLMASRAIAGLYLCPFCNNGVDIETRAEDAKRFDCQECGKISCRVCRKSSHEGPCHPQEHSKDEEQTAQFVVTCCGEAFVRGDGCNKLTCRKCGEKWCWVCKQKISRGNPYAHFQGNGHQGKCILWGDPPAQLHTPAPLPAREKPARFTPYTKATEKCSALTALGLPCQNRASASWPKGVCYVHRDHLQPKRRHPPHIPQRPNTLVISETPATPPQEHATASSSSTQLAPAPSSAAASHHGSEDVIFICERPRSSSKKKGKEKINSNIIVID